MSEKNKANGFKAILYFFVALSLGIICGWPVLKQWWPALLVMGLIMFIWEYPANRKK